MALAMAVIVFLVGACLGVLVGCYLVLSRLTAGASSQIADIAHQLASAEATARSLAEEQIGHRDATTAILVDRLLLVGSQISQDLRQAAQERQTLLRWLLLMEDREPAESTREPLADAAPVVPDDRRTQSGVPGACTLPPDAPTPPQGYPVGPWLDSRRRPRPDGADGHDMA